jgi:hypothetical protein
VGAYEIVGGVPARRIGQRFASDIVEELLDWRWWDLPEDELHKLGPFVAAAEDWPSLLPSRNQALR